MLVPLKLLKPPPALAEITLTPGAEILTRSLEKFATEKPLGLSCKAPTAIIPLPAAGGATATS